MMIVLITMHKKKKRVLFAVSFGKYNSSFSVEPYSFSGKRCMWYVIFSSSLECSNGVRNAFRHDSIIEVDLHFYMFFVAMKQNPIINQNK